MSVENDEFFFFSSRRRHTRLVSDWSSDVCSSDLPRRARHPRAWESPRQSSEAGREGKEAARRRYRTEAMGHPRPEGRILEDKAHPENDERSHQGGPDRGDGPGAESRERQGRRRLLCLLRLPNPGAAVMKGAVTASFSGHDPHRLVHTYGLHKGSD